MADIRTDIPANVQLQEPAALIEVFCLQARNLPKVESAMSDQSNTYCVVEVTSSHQMYKTHTVKSSLHPVWNESYQVKISNASQQMMTVKIMAEKEGRHDEFIGVVVVPVSRIMAGEGGKEGGWYEIRGEKSNVVVGPDGMSKIELSFAGRIAQPGLQPSLGWLTLRGSGDNWKRYFFMLDPYNQMIRYFANPEAVSDAAPKALGEFNIRCCQVDDVDYDAPYPNTFKVKTFFGRMLMYSDSPEERDRWVDTLREVGNPIGIRSLPAPPLANNRNSLSMSPPASSDAIAVRKQPVQPEQPPSQHEPPAQPELPAQREPAPVQQPVPVQVVQQVQRITPPATREIPPLQQPAASTTAPLTKSAQSPPQSGDSHMQLQRKFEATRRALADHVAKCRNLEGQLQEAKAAQAAQPGGEENVQMQAEIERLKGDKVRMEEALTRERRNAAEMANSSKGGSELAVEIQQLRISLEKQSADLKTKESEMKEMAVQIKSLEVQLDNAKAQVDDACKNATLGSNESTQELRREIDKLEAENKSLKEKYTESNKMLPWSIDDQEKISQLTVENRMLRDQLENVASAKDDLAVSRLEGEVKMLKENLASEQHQVMEISQRMKEAHEKEMHAHQQLNELQAIDRDHDYWPKVMRGKDEDLIKLRDHVERLSGDNRRLIADNQEMKARHELGRTALSNEVNQHKERASHHEVELRRRIEEVEKRAISAAEGYHASLQALEAERNELRRDFHESQHALSEMKKKYLQLQQEKVHAEAELEGVRKSDVQEQQLKQQVAMLQSQLQQAVQENGGKAKATTSQDAARELIADITSTLSVRSSRIMQTSSGRGPSSGQNGSINLALKGDLASKGGYEDDPYLM